MLEGTFLLFSAAVIAANLIADLLLTGLRPEGAERMSAPSAPPAEPAARAAATAPSARQIARVRRRRALAGFWREYRKDRGGMIGLVILLVLIVVALAAPLLASSSGLNAALATYPANAGPGLALPARHRRRRPVGADRADLGVPDLAADRLHRHLPVAW